MATTITCDRCDTKIFGTRNTMSTYYGHAGITDKWDLCMTCYREIIKYMRDKRHYDEAAK